MPDMDKCTRVGVVGAMLHRLPPRAAGYYARLAPRPSEVKDDFYSFPAGNSTQAQHIQALAQLFWPVTFRLDCAALGQPIGPVRRQNSFEAYLGPPMKQRAQNTCALVACTVCVEALYRLEHAKNNHGEGAFPYTAAVPDENSTLLNACRREGIWVPREGAKVGAVLDKIQQQGGVLAAATSAPTPAPCRLPLRDWQVHSGAGLSPEGVAELLDRHGPCVGTLWVLPWYRYFDADLDDALVYRGCGGSGDDRRRSKIEYGDKNVGGHAVVCVGYRILRDGQMHVKVLDNHGPTGPRRWVDVEELVALYTLTVHRLPFVHFL